MLTRAFLAGVLALVLLPSSSSAQLLYPATESETVLQAVNSPAYETAASDPTVAGGVEADGTLYQTATTTVTAPTFEYGGMELCAESACPANGTAPTTDTTTTNVVSMSEPTTTQATTLTTESRTAAESDTPIEAIASGSRGCRHRWAGALSRTLFGSVFYRFRLNVVWCWNSRAISSVDRWVEFLDAAPTADYKGIVNRKDMPYCIALCWSAYNRFVGYMSYRQGRVDNCILKYGCIRTEYPWVRIRVYNNGSWSHRTGGV
jgi:hypothetical protein